MNAALRRPIAQTALPLLFLLACAPQAPVQAETRTCDTVAEFPARTELAQIGGLDGWSISATPGIMTCSDPTPDGWGCVFAGPASVRVSSADSATEHLYAIAEGEMGAVTVGRDGVSCSLRSAQ